MKLWCFRHLKRLRPAKPAGRFLPTILLLWGVLSLPGLVSPEADTARKGPIPSSQANVSSPRRKQAEPTEEKPIQEGQERQPREAEGEPSEAGPPPQPEGEEAEAKAEEKPAPPPPEEAAAEVPVPVPSVPRPKGVQPPEIQPIARPALSVPELDQMEKEAALKIFGSDFFAQAVTTPVQENLPPPATYTLGPQDELEVRYWSKVRPEEVIPLVVDEAGQINLPPVGNLTVAGLTLQQCQNLVADQLGRFFRGLKVHVTLTQLRGIQVFIVGEVQRPGRRNMSPLATVLDALYRAGGPNPGGSFRQVRLERGRRTIATYDLYDLLMTGRMTKELTLLDRDTIFVPATGPRVAVFGEVVRPAYYELRGGERLRDVLQLAGGLRAAQYQRRILIDRLVDNERRILLDVDARAAADDPASNPVIQDGDRIVVLRVASPHRQIVTIAGPVVRPGTFQLTEGMRISDLIAAAEGLNPQQQVLMEQGELYRQQPDGSIQLLSFNVERALQKDPAADLPLTEWDRVVLYPATQVWPHYVTIEGNVPRPGNYQRVEGMTVKDLLLAAGGPAPDTYLREAHLLRVTSEEKKETLKIDLSRARAGDPQHNLLLQDRDVLRLFAYGEVEERVLRVTVEGAVRRPGNYDLKVGMKVRDLLFEAGGPVPNQAFMTQADLRRMNEDGTRRIERINLLLAQQDDPQHNLELQHEDLLHVYSWQERQARDQWVRIEGAVARPGEFELKEGMTVQDLLNEAGGTLPKQAHLEQAHLIRVKPDQQREILTLNLIEVQNSNPEHNLLLQGQDILRVYTWNEIEYRLKTVHVRGAVARPGDYEWTAGMTIRDLLLMAGGVLPNSAYLDRAELTRTYEDQTRKTIPVDLRAAQAGDTAHNLILEGDDELRVYTYDQVQFNERLVYVEGAVVRPGEYEWTRDMTVADLLFKAGGPLPREAYLSRAHLYRRQPDGSTALIVVNLQRALDKEPGANLLLQQRDRLRVFTYDDVQNRLRFVKVEGAVTRPQKYEWHEGMTVQDLLAEAGGPLTNQAYLERAYLIRARPDQIREMIPINLIAARDSDPKHNLVLQPDDVLRVYTHREAQIPLDTVRIEGAVARPGEYELKQGMTVQDLLQEAGGYLPNKAYLSRADLQRARPDQTRETLAIDLRQALDSNPAHNLPLQGDDVLHVYTWDEYQYRDKMVTIEGAVARPDTYELTQNMRVSDLLVKAGGPLPKEAYLEQAHLIRTLPDQTQEIHRLDLRRVQEHDPQHDLPLEGRDRLRVFTHEEAQFLEKEVTIKGAVQRPGTYPWKRGMRVSDLLQEAGGPIPKMAFLRQADLERLQEDGKTRILRVDLERVLERDEKEDLELQGRDVLRVFTYREVEFREPVVYIYGAVQKPGMYIRPEGLTLSDLIRKAGGILPGTDPMAEIARLDGKQVVILQANLEALLSQGDKTQDLVLQDHDRVSIRRPTEYIPRPAAVELRGEVRLPGFFNLEGRQGSLYEVLQRAGGLTPEAFPEGVVFIRKVDLLVPPEQTRSVRQVADTLRQVADMRFRAWLATQSSGASVLQQLGSSASQGAVSSTPAKSRSTSASSTAPKAASKTRAPANPEAEMGLVQPQEEAAAPNLTSSEAAPSSGRQSSSDSSDSGLTTSEAAALTRITGPLAEEAETSEEVVLPSRPLMEIIPSGRIPIDLRKILDSQGQEDIQLQDGDILVVPKRPQHVIIAGAVTKQGAVIHDPKLRLKDYLKLMGGITRDADLKHIAIVKADGRVFQGRLRDFLEVGDFVLIPTKAMLYEPGRSWQERLQQVLSNVLNAATLFLVVNRL